MEVGYLDLYFLKNFYTCTPSKPRY